MLVEVQEALRHQGKTRLVRLTSAGKYTTSVSDVSRVSGTLVL